MLPPSAIERAVKLLRDPICVGRMRSDTLPPDVSVLLRILAGDTEAEAHAARFSGKSQVTVREAAEFYVTQVLFNSAADPYRILGVRPDATRVELRTNLALLLRWLHPDVAGPTHRGMAERAIKAWHDLKVPESRSAVDQGLAKSRDANRRRRAACRVGEKPNGRRPLLAATIKLDATSKRRRKMALIALVLIAGLCSIVAYVPDEIASATSSFIASIYPATPYVTPPNHEEGIIAKSRSANVAPPSTGDVEPDRHGRDGQ